jgi:VWFA-related protein
VPALLALVLVGASFGGFPNQSAAQPPAARGPSSQESGRAVSPFRERLDIIEILVDVQVTDRSGVVIEGLEAVDFVARVGGERVPITSVVFRSVSSREVPDGAPVMAATERAVPIPRVTEPRYFVLVFHDLMRSDYETLGVTAQQSIAAALARFWVEQDLEVGDLVAIASFDYKLKIHADFTNDPEVLRAALRAVPMRRDADRNGRHPEVASGPSLLRQLPRGTELRDQTRSIREALGTLARALRPLEGRKQLVLFSIGVGLSSALAPALNASNIDVYTVDISPPKVEHLQAVALEALARDTEGHFFRWGGALAALRRVSQRTAGYYQLSLRVDAAQVARGQRVDVDVSRRDVRVTARRRHLESAPTTRR